MAKRLLGVILCAAAFVGPAFWPDAAQAQSGEQITSFASNIVVHADGTVAISERIEYLFPAPKHGIYRDIPTRYVSDDGRRYEIPLEVASVTDAAGTPWRYELQRQSNGIRIKIGDPDVTIDGLQTYVITYVAHGALRYFDNHDELYWNVTGSGWQVPVGRVSATVRLPDAVDPAAVTFTCYTGPTGSTSKDCLANTQGRTVSFIADSGPLTIVTGWQPGVVARLDPIESKNAGLGTVSASAAIAISGIPLFVILGLYLYWRSKGRDPLGKRALVVQYDPPAGLLPAEVGTIMDERADPRDITATVVDLAVRGHIVITEVVVERFGPDGKDYILRLLPVPEGAVPLKPYEEKIVDALFGTFGTCQMSDLKKDYSLNARMQGILGSIYEDVTVEGYFDQNPQKVRNIFVGIAIVLAVVPIFFVEYASSLGLHAVLLIAALFVSGIIVLIAGFAMPRRTEKGALAYEHARGFKEYLARAEKYRLEWQEKEHKFESFLPYAMVYGVVDKWTTALAAMHVTPPSPSWYQGSSSGAFNAAMFASSMNGFSSSMSGAMQASKSTSGSGFSGGSGGGGGGGGGGSW